MKTPPMESGRLSSNSNLETAAILENLGGCCEGTVFTFTSAGSRWRLRQRLNRNKASLVSAHGGLLLREDPADSVFTEMRIMPRSSEPNPSNAVELWDRNKMLNSVRTEESSRANSMANYGSADLRDYCSDKKFTGQVGGDVRAKVFSQQAVKADHERRELQVSTEETTPRKSRRYVRCDNSRERHRYGDVVEEDKIWTWNEKKLEEVRAHELSNETIGKGYKPAEERRNKRESSAEEIHVFEQRKVKCRRREQDSFSTHSESVRSEDLSKADDVKRASYGFNHRQGVPEEPRKQQAGPVVAICPYVANESTKNRRGGSIDSAEEIEDRRSNNVANQNSVFELHIQRGNGTEENRSWIAPRPSTPPIACSFISFKGGVSCVGNRRCEVLGNASSRARRFPEVEHRAIATCDGNETPSQILNDNRLVQDSNRHGLSISPNRNQRILEISFPRRNAEMEGGDAQIKTGRKQRPEALEDLKSMGREKEGVMISETRAGNSSHNVGPVVPFHQRPLSKELSSSWSSRTTEGSFDRGGDALSGWERSHSGISKSKHTSVSEGESGPRRIDVSKPEPPKVEGPRGRLSSSLLDCHGSLQVEDGLETTDLDGDDQRSNERECKISVRKGEAEGPSPAPGRLESGDDIFEGSLERLDNFPLAEVNCCESSGVPNKSVSVGNADLEENLRCEIASNFLGKSTALELENQSFRESVTDIPDGTHSTKISCTSRSEVVDLDLQPQKSVPLRRHAWVKGFKKKTGEKVSYFESWLGRSKKLHKTSPGRKCGSKGVGELSQANRIVDKHDKSRPFGQSIDQHLISQAWSKKESQAYVTKEFEILEAVLQSEVNVDDDQAEAADHLQNASIKSSAELCIVDKEEGKWEEGGTMTGQSNSQEVDAVSLNTVATNLETEDNIVQSKCTAGDGLPLECGEHPEAENSQQLHWANMPRTCKDFATLNYLGEKESSRLVSVSNSTGGQAKECRQTDEAEGHLALPHINSAAEGLNVTSERLSLKPKDVLECSVSERGIKTRLERSRDKHKEMFPQSKDTPCCTLDAQITGLAEQCGMLFEKEKRNQSNKVTAAPDKMAEGMKPVSHPTVLNDSRDISTNKVLNRSDFAVGELNVEDRFVGLATAISGLEDHTSKKSYPSDLTGGCGSHSDVLDSLVQTESVEHIPFNKPSSAVSQQVPSPVQASSVPDIVQQGKQVKSSSVKMLQGARDVADEDSSFALKSVSRTDIGQSTDRRRAEISLNTADLECSSANFTSGIDFDHFPSSIKAPTEKQNSGAERKRESPVNRRHKMPIIVRVRNRLANGWLLQHPLWKRVAKHKMKTGESQALAIKGINQNEAHADPSSLTSGQRSTGDLLTDLNESRTEHAINLNPPSKHDTELTGTSIPQNFTLEAYHQTCAMTEKSHQGRLGDFDTCKYHLSIEGMEKKPSTSENLEIVRQNQLNKKQAPSRNHDEAAGEHTKEDCPGQASSVLSFAEWQNLAKGFSKSSPSTKRIGENSDSVVKESEREVTELGKINELNDVGELLSVVCLGNIVKEATVLGTFSDFNDRCEIPMVLGEGKVERDSGGFKQVSVDVCGSMMPAVCRGKQEKVSAVSQMSSDCSADEHIFHRNSETATSSYCQTEPVALAKFPDKTEDCIPVDSPANRCSENKNPSAQEDAESGLSQECKSLQKTCSLNDHYEELQTCSSASLHHAFARAPYIPGRMQITCKTGDSNGEQPQLDGQSDGMCLIPQVEDFLGYLSIEGTVGQSASSAPFQCQICPGTADKELHDKSLSNLVEPIGQVEVVAPFCPPLQAANSSGKEMARGDGTVKERGMEDRRMSSSQMKGWQADPAMSCHSAGEKLSGDLKQWEIMEMLKLPNNQPQLLSGQGAKDFSRKVNQEHVYRTGQQTNAWEKSCRRDCGGSHRTLCWKDMPAPQNPNDLSTEDQIFLERFSATSNNLKSCELSESGFSAYSKIGVRSSGQPYNSSPDLSSQMRLLSAPGRLSCGRIGSLSSDRSVDPASLPSEVQWINSLPPSLSTRSSLGEAGRPHTSQEDKYDRHSTFEAKLVPDYAASFNCPSPCSSVNRSLDDSERRSSWARPCTDCLSKYGHQETCVQCANGMHDWKHSAAPGCVPSRMTHNTSFPAQCQSLLLNSRPNSCLSNTSQPSTQCRCDACYLSCRFSPPVLLSCHHPPCINAVHNHRQCHFPGRSQFVPVSSDQPVKSQNTSTTAIYGQNVQCPKQDTLPPYIPLQVIQPTGICRPLSQYSEETVLPHERHQFADKDRVTHDDQVGGQPRSSRTKETNREQGLVWLSPEELNLIQQLRLSGEKAMAICRHDAAACIQRYWRKYLEKNSEDLKVEREHQAPVSSLLTEYQMWHDHSQYCKLRQVVSSQQLCGYSPKELSQENLVRTVYRTMQNAARIIQRAWRSVLRNRKEKTLARRELPKDLKNFYDIIKGRQAASGRLAPSFELFAKSVERIQAATEGARVRRRLKSHRLQTIIMEIKEIRMLLSEMSQEENCNSTPFLFPQLCNQLRQKILQLHAALNGKQMEARFLLRRCPATPLMLHSSRSMSPKPIYLMPNQKSVDQALAKLSSGVVGGRKFYAPPLTNPASVVSDNRIARSDASKIQSAVPSEQKLIHTQSFVPLIQGSKGNTTELQNTSSDPPDSADTQNSAKLLQWYFLGQGTPSKRTAGQGTLTDFSRGHDAIVKKGIIETLDPSQKNCDPSFSSPKVSPKLKGPEYNFNKSFDDQPLPVPQRSKIQEMPFEEMVVGGSNASMYLTEYAPSTDSIDKPKRPFLKRKSRVMPPQKLDWSKVKPMVSSRLEPELKTKLSLCKGSSKEPSKNNSKKKKANYSNVKSRLFSYEENVSPSDSADGTCLQIETNEAGYPPMVRGGCRESRGSETGRNSGVLVNRQRAASPDLMHLRRMADADRHCSQHTMQEAQSGATYSSHFNSARYLHKLENSEGTSKDTLVGSCQQRTQRIRLRIVPRSKENEVGDLFVQDEMPEMWEDQSPSAHGKGKRQQSHSHRYAIYQEQDARYSSRVTDTTSPDCAEEDRNATGRASRKPAQALSRKPEVTEATE